MVRVRPLGDAKVIVLHTVREPTSTTNPYVHLMLESIRHGTTARFFSYRTALFGRYHLVHIQWPESLVRAGSGVAAVLKTAALLGFLLRIHIQRVPVVQTIHNLKPHEDGGWRERLLLRLIDKRTIHWIRINRATPERHPATTTILHGHYKDWFGTGEPRSPRNHRVLYFGQIRPYKGVERLLAAFEGLKATDIDLRLVGPVLDETLAKQIAESAEEQRISFELNHLDDDALAREIDDCAVVVLPYRSMHNSGALLLALSLGRSVLVPDNESTRLLSEEVGSEWVSFFHDELTAMDIQLAVARASGLNYSRPPSLHQRDWHSAGRDLVKVYRTLLQL